MESSKHERQFRIEVEGAKEAIQKYRKTRREYEAEGRAHELPPQIRLMGRLLEPTVQGIEEFMVSSARVGNLLKVRSLLEPCDPHELAYLTLRVVLDGISRPQYLQAVARKLGTTVMGHLDYLSFKQVHPGILCNMEKRFKKNCSSAGHRKRAVSAKRLHINEFPEIESIPESNWDLETQLHVGMKLIDILIQRTGVAEKGRTSIAKKDKLGSMILLTASPDTLEWIQEAHERCEVMRPHCQPMIVPPIPWTNVTGGGFLSRTGHKGKLINSRLKEHRDNQNVEGMSQVFDAVNAIQNTKWRVNKPILETLIQIWTTTDGMGLLPETSELEDRLPPAFWNSDAEYKGMTKKREDGSYPEERKLVLEWKAKRAEIYSDYHCSRSARVAVAKQISIASDLKEEEELYFVHFLDWRGRIYPRSPFVNPQSDDVGSALIEFGNGKPITEAGVKWLAVHVANSYGYDKASRNDRIKWVEEHEKEILGSARDPLGEDGWFWRELDESGAPKADSPFCFLAACMAWAQYTAEGPDAAIHLPIQVDGSCNGLQHFAALLSDEVGGAAVNVAGMVDWDQKPSDVYGLVAADMQKRVDVELLSDEVVAERKVGDKVIAKYTRKQFAQLLTGHISRSLVKRNVMTTPYGATKRGMRQQNKKILEDNGIIVEEDMLMPFLAYMTDLVYESIGSVVISARSAMDWMQQLAACYNTAKKQIVWTTPSGFTVTQGYLKQKTKRIETVFGKESVKLSLSLDTDQLNTSKQKLGIAPNFIHSLDATHLVWTVNECVRRGVTDFSMIHDSYGTHACDMEVLARVLREMFVKLYEGKDYLKELELACRATVNADKLPPCPQKGGLNHKDVLENCNFFG